MLVLESLHTLWQNWMAETLPVSIVLKLVWYLLIGEHVALDILTGHLNPFILCQTPFIHTTLGSLCYGLIRIHYDTCILLHVH